MSLIAGSIRAMFRLTSRFFQLEMSSLPSLSEWARDKNPVVLKLVSLTPKRLFHKQAHVRALAALILVTAFGDSVESETI